LLWELVTREIPYDGLDAIDIKSKVIAEEKLDLPYNVNKSVANLISDCRKVDPKSRPSFDYIKGVLDGIVK
jgi:serine/threonine protein kinase